MRSKQASEQPPRSVQHRTPLTNQLTIAQQKSKQLLHYWSGNKQYEYPRAYQVWKMCWTGVKSWYYVLKSFIWCGGKRTQIFRAQLESKLKLIKRNSNDLCVIFDHFFYVDYSASCSTFYWVCIFIDTTQHIPRLHKMSRDIVLVSTCELEFLIQKWYDPSFLMFTSVWALFKLLNKT